MFSILSRSLFLHSEIAGARAWKYSLFLFVPREGPEDLEKEFGPWVIVNWQAVERVHKVQEKHFRASELE